MAQETEKRDRKRRPQGRRPARPRAASEFEEKVLDIARVTRVVAGGKRFRFRATVALGDRKGRVGIGVAKGNDVAQAIAKAAHQAKKSLVIVPIVKGTIPREVTVKYKAAKIFLKPAPSGRGINAGGAVRVLSDLAGISDIIAKSLSRTSNKINTARATLEAFKELSRSKREIPSYGSVSRVNKEEGTSVEPESEGQVGSSEGGSSSATTAE